MSVLYSTIKLQAGSNKPYLHQVKGSLIVQKGDLGVNWRDEEQDY